MTRLGELRKKLEQDYFKNLDNRRQKDTKRLELDEQEQIVMKRLSRLQERIEHEVEEIRKAFSRASTALGQPLIPDLRVIEAALLGYTQILRNERTLRQLHDQLHHAITYIPELVRQWEGHAQNPVLRPHIKVALHLLKQAGKDMRDEISNVRIDIEIHEHEKEELKARGF